jgi:hypothetical protein
MIMARKLISVSPREARNGRNGEPRGLHPSIVPSPMLPYVFLWCFSPMSYALYRLEKHPLSNDEILTIVDAVRFTRDRPHITLMPQST